MNLLKKVRVTLVLLMFLLHDYSVEFIIFDDIVTNVTLKSRSRSIVCIQTSYSIRPTCIWKLNMHQLTCKENWSMILWQGACCSNFVKIRWVDSKLRLITSQPIRSFEVSFLHNVPLTPNNEPQIFFSTSARFIHFKFLHRYVPYYTYLFNIFPP